MTEESSEAKVPRDAEESLIRLLLFDVMIAQTRLKQDETQSCMRDLIRCVFAAIDGLSWIYREHIVSAAKEVGTIAFPEEMALSEVAYHVSNDGTINKQPRFLPVPAAIRLTTRIAEKLNPDLHVSFNSPGWNSFRNAGAIRNRITHPKKRSDLLLTSEDVSLCVSALFWLLELTESAMTAANFAFAAHSAEMREIFEDLERGDAETWEMYRAALLSRNE